MAHRLLSASGRSTPRSVAATACVLGTTCARSGLAGAKTPWYRAGHVGDAHAGQIDAVTRDTQSDAILVAHLVSASVDAEFEEGRVDIKSTCRGGSPVDLFLYDREELREPDSVRVAHTVTMVSYLYDVRNEKRVWTIQSTCFDKADFDSVLRQEADAIVRQLRADDLIEPRGG